MEKDSKLLQPNRHDEKNTGILGISTTNSNDNVAPRKSTSEGALSYALDYAKNDFGAETKMIKLRDLHSNIVRDTSRKMLVHAYFMFNFRDG